MEPPRNAAEALARRDAAIAEAHRQYRHDLLALRNVSTVHLGTRARMAIRNLGLNNPKEIAKIGRKEFSRTPNLGRKSVDEIETWLFQKGHQLAP